MFHLASDPQVFPQIVQLVGSETEMLSRDFAGVNCLVSRRGKQAVEDEPRVGFLQVKLVSVMGDDDIRLVQVFPQLSYKFSVVFGILLIERIIGKSFDNGLLPFPFDGKRKYVPFSPE